MELDFKVFLSVDFDKTIVNNRLVTLNYRSHEVAHNLETNWSSILDLNVEVGNAFSSLS